MKSVSVLRAVAATMVVAAVAAAPLAYHATADAQSKAATPTKGAAAKTAPAKAAPAVKGDAALGKPLFVKNCVVCHKADGSGGMKLTGNPTPNWKDPKTWADPQRTDEYLRDCITNGKVKSGMVAWVGKKGPLKPADVEHLIAYIKTFKPAKKK